MVNVAQQAWALSGTAVSLALAVYALLGSRKAWRHHQHPVDLVMFILASVWVLHLIASTSLDIALDNFASAKASISYEAQLSFQVLIVGVSFFLLVSASVTKIWAYLLLALQLLSGLAALHWHRWSADAHQTVYLSWIFINLVTATLLTLILAFQAYLSSTLMSRLALAGGIVGLILCVDELWMTEKVPHKAQLLRHFYAAFLVMTWHLNTLARTGSTLDFQRETGFLALTGFGPDDDAIAVAVSHERRRIAQDLHDGVGTQIVSILSSLDSSAPQQQAISLALEQCLLDLKMTVDAIDVGNDNVRDALGSLRYRVQHSLDKLGICMVWKVEMGDELDAVRGVFAQQVLRIAQESLANVMRHAHASAVEVSCRYVPEKNQLVLEVRDNGQGIPRAVNGRPYGKGLEGMRRRALAIGGKLVISSKPDVGTRVRLTLPLNGIRH